MKRLMPVQSLRNRGQGGFTLVEVIIALAILGTIGVAFMLGLSASYRARGVTEEQVQAASLARAALEEVRSNDLYNGPGCNPDCYSYTRPLPTGYSVAIVTQAYCTPEPCDPAVDSDGNIQKNSVTVSRGGQPLLTIEDLKTRR